MGHSAELRQVVSLFIHLFLRLFAEVHTFQEKKLTLLGNHMDEGKFSIYFTFVPLLWLFSMFDFSFGSNVLAQIWGVKLQCQLGWWTRRGPDNWRVYCVLALLCPSITMWRSRAGLVPSIPCALWPIVGTRSMRSADPVCCFSLLSVQYTTSSPTLLSRSKTHSLLLVLLTDCLNMSELCAGKQLQ